MDDTNREEHIKSSKDKLFRDIRSDMLKGEHQSVKDSINNYGIKVYGMLYQRNSFWEDYRDWLLENEPQEGRFISYSNVAIIYHQ